MSEFLAVSVSHQLRVLRGCQHLQGGSSEHPLPQPGMAIASHDVQIRGDTMRLVRDNLADAPVPALGANNPDVGAVSSKMLPDPRSGIGVGLGVDDKNNRASGLFDEARAFAHGACRRMAVVPGDENGANRSPWEIPRRKQQKGTSAAEKHGFDETAP